MFQSLGSRLLLIAYTLLVLGVMGYVGAFFASLIALGSGMSVTSRTPWHLYASFVLCEVVILAVAFGLFFLLYFAVYWLYHGALPSRRVTSHV